MSIERYIVKPLAGGGEWGVYDTAENPDWPFVTYNSKARATRRASALNTTDEMQEEESEKIRAFLEEPLPQEIIVLELRGSGGNYVIAQALEERWQYPSISPRQYKEVARVWDINDVAEVAKAFDWVPEGGCADE